jgi:hypothetical protein
VPTMARASTYPSASQYLCFYVPICTNCRLPLVSLVSRSSPPPL